MYQPIYCMAKTCPSPLTWCYMYLQLAPLSNWYCPAGLFCNTANCDVRSKLFKKLNNFWEINLFRSTRAPYRHDLSSASFSPFQWWVWKWIKYAALSAKYLKSNSLSENIFSIIVQSVGCLITNETAYEELFPKNVNVFLMSFIYFVLVLLFVLFQCTYLLFYMCYYVIAHYVQLLLHPDVKGRRIISLKA